MTKPLVTIGIPTFNYGRYLEEAIASALGQVGANVEVLVSDNCSTDETLAVLRRFRDPRLRWWTNVSNEGVYPNWDRLVREARGEYFKILQADDWLEPMYVSTCIDAIDETGADLVFTGFRNIGDSTDVVLPSSLGLNGRLVPLTREEVGKHLWELSHFVQPTFGLYRRTLVPEGYGGDARSMSRDMVFWSRALVRGRPVLVNESLAIQRIHGAQDRKRRDSSEGIKDLLDALEIARGLGPGAHATIEAMATYYSTVFLRSALRRLLSAEVGSGWRILSYLSARGRLVGALRNLCSGNPIRDLRYEEFERRTRGGTPRSWSRSVGA